MAEIEAIAEATEGEDPGAEATERIRGFLEADPDWPLLFYEFWSLSVRNPELQGELAKRRDAIRDALAETLERVAAQAGFELRFPAPMLATAIAASINGLAFEHAADPDALPDEVFAEFVTAVLGCAIAAGLMPTPTELVTGSLRGDQRSRLRGRLRPARSGLRVARARAHADRRPAPRSAEIRKAVETQLEVFDEFRIQPEAFHEHGDRVAVPVKQTARGGVSGVELEIRIGHLWTVRDGKAVRLEVFPAREDARKAAELADEAEPTR